MPNTLSSDDNFATLLEINRVNITQKNIIVLIFYHLIILEVTILFFKYFIIFRQEKINKISLNVRHKQEILVLFSLIAKIRLSLGWVFLSYQNK